MKILALDLSTKPGWAIIKSGKCLAYGNAHFPILNFNVNNYPERAKEYPYNIIETSQQVADYIFNIYQAESDIDVVVIENTVRGKNRNTQRSLEWVHYAVLSYFVDASELIHYVDPTQWRKALEMKLTPADKENNKLVKNKLGRGKITSKHLSVRFVNSEFDLNLKMKDNDIADAICIGLAYERIIKNDPR